MWGEFIVNCDAAIWKSGQMGLGFIHRDEYGNVLLVGKFECMTDGSSTLMEALAVCTLENEAISFICRCGGIGL